MESQTRPSTPLRTKPNLGLTIWQWCASALTAWLALGPTLERYKLDSPGAPSIEMYWWITGALALLALLHSPPLFLRLPFKVKWLVYGCALIGFSTLEQYEQTAQFAYEKTPAGAKEAARIKAQLDAVAEAGAKARERSEAAEIERELAEEKADRLTKLEGCLSWSDQIPSVVEHVKERLHNPHAFEHVSTRITDSSSDFGNVEMTFRAENGFGALRLATARAIVDPDTCKASFVSSIDEQG